MTSIIEESKKARQRSLLGFLKNKKFIYGVVLLVFLGVSFYLYSNKSLEEEVGETKKEWTVKNGDIIVSIEADGKVVAKDGVELSFSVTGDNLEVDRVFVKEGDKIKKGDKIASVKTEVLDFNLRSSWSAYQSALADYNEIIDGATKQEKLDAQDKISSAELSLNQAKISLENTKQNVEDSIYDAQKKLEDAKDELDDNYSISNSKDVEEAYENLVDLVKSINISLDSVLKDSDKMLGVDQENLNDDFEDNLGVKDKGSLSRAEASYRVAKESLSLLNSLALSINIKSSYSDIDETASQAVLTLQEFEKHLYDLKLMLDETITSSSFSQTELNSLISSVSSDRAIVNTKITSLNSEIRNVEDTKSDLDEYKDDYEDALRDLEVAKSDGARDIENAETNVSSKEILLEQAKRDYDDLMAPLTETELASARSRLTSASINFEKAQYDLDKSILTSPIDGELVQLNYAVGDIIITDDNRPVATIINNDTLFIEVNIEESDISKLELGQKVYAQFDALDGTRLEGEVSFISLTSETSNNGIVTYLVRVIFSKGENEIREGMTANIEFVTSEARDVLMIPVSAVRNVSGKPSVLLQDNQWVPVITGFTDGKNVEVISGLSLSDKILY